MDQRQLLFFVTLAEELHFVRAAGRLRITQPALSQQIAHLEDRVGARLFDRTKRHVALTEAGKVFLEEAHSILRQMEIAVRSACRAASGQTGRLTVGFVEAAMLNILPTLVAAVRRALPDVFLILQEMVTQEQMDALHSGRIDIGLLRPMFTDHNLQSVLIFREPYLVALPKEHELARCASIDIAQLRDVPFIVTLPQKRRYLETRFRAEFQRLGFEPRISQEVNQLHGVVGLVGAGLGVALVPRSASRFGLHGVVFKPLRDRKLPNAELIAAWRNDTTNAATRQFIEVAKRTLKQKVDFGAAR
jgi:DNA-binding transcriptional LysR family regulator